MTFGTIVLAQLRYLVSNLQKKNAKASVAEIESLLQLYGDAAVGWLLTILLQEIDFKTSQQKDAFKVALLAQEFPRLTARPNAGTLVCEVFQAAFPAGSGALSEETLHGVAKAAKASLAQQLAVGLGLARSHDSAVSMEGIKFLKTKLSELGSGAGGGGGGAGGGQKEGVGSLPAELVHALLFFLDRSDGFSRQRAALVKLLQAAHPEERCPLALLPLLWTADRETGDLDCRLSFEKERARAPPPAARSAAARARGGELASLMEDLGYSCCATAKCFAEVLEQFEVPAEAAVGAAVAMMARTAAGTRPAPPARVAPARAAAELPPFSPHTPPPRPPSAPRRPLTPPPPPPLAARRLALAVRRLSTAVSERYLEFDAKLDADGEGDAVKARATRRARPASPRLTPTPPAPSTSPSPPHLTLSIPHSPGAHLVERRRLR